MSSLALDIIASVPRVEGCPVVFSSGKVPVNSWEWTKDQLDAPMRRRSWNGEAWVIHDLRRTVRCRHASARRFTSPRRS
jgi:hypothetical protein